MFGKSTQQWTPQILRWGGLVLLLLALYLALTNLSFEELKRIAEEHRIQGAVLFGMLMFTTTVIAPLTSLPLVPMIAPFLGPFTTGLACYIGWVLGAVVAFWIGRTYGQPLVARYISIETIKKYETYIRPDMGFVLITVLHMVIPVDIFSYAIAMFTTVSLRIYTLATMLGILWFSFAFAYLGDALVNQDYVLLGILGVASVLILYISWRYVRKAMRTEAGK